MLSLKCEHSFFNVKSPFFSTVTLYIQLPNSSIDSKFGFSNVGLGLCILTGFTQFMKEMENWGF